MRFRLRPAASPAASGGSSFRLTAAASAPSATRPPCSPACSTACRRICGGAVKRLRGWRQRCCRSGSARRPSVRACGSRRGIPADSPRARPGRGAPMAVAAGAHVARAAGRIQEGRSHALDDRVGSAVRGAPRAARAARHPVGRRGHRGRHCRRDRDRQRHGRRVPSAASLHAARRPGPDRHDRRALRPRAGSEFPRRRRPSRAGAIACRGCRIRRLAGHRGRRGAAAVSATGVGRMDLRGARRHGVGTRRPTILDGAARVALVTDRFARAARRRSRGGRRAIDVGADRARIGVLPPSADRFAGGADVWCR